MQFNQVLDDGQSQPQPSMSPCRGGVSLAKALKQVRLPADLACIIANHHQPLNAGETSEGCRTALAAVAVANTMVKRRHPYHKKIAPGDVPVALLDKLRLQSLEDAAGPLARVIDLAALIGES